MAAQAEQTDETVAAPPTCGPCRGTGRVRSNLGGTEHEVTCPWCEGGGRFIPGHDAQAAAPADPGPRP
jgi:DnaJ-class molecular chaperone